MTVVREQEHHSASFLTPNAWSLSGRLAEGGENRSIALVPLPFFVGRRSGLSLTLSQQTVSSLHARLYVQDGRLFVQDLNSTNGTYLNGTRLLKEHVLEDGDLLQFADVALRVSRQVPDLPSNTRVENASDQAMALVQFDQLLMPRTLRPHFQAIVDLATSKVVAYEALARSRLIGLETPDRMFAAAEQVGLSAELSEACRREALEQSHAFPEPPHLFLNTHGSELAGRSLSDACIRLRKFAPTQELTIEIHETAIFNGIDIANLCRQLANHGISIAFDDFGIGQSRIAELAAVCPKYVKFDQSLVLEMHTADPARRRIIGGLVSAVRDIGILPIAEGIETAEVAEACRDIGFALGQGFYLGKPMSIENCVNAFHNPAGGKGSATVSLGEGRQV
jgi:EAL domain-containing protein (putative c-di-GMP-specific phosphodiesterase class I)